MNEFIKGQKIDVVSGGQLEIIEKLGEGGQGIVYRVEYEGKEYALKWYFEKKLGDRIDSFYMNIQNNIKEGSPDDVFLWPQKITEYYEDSFGYLMDLRPKEYKDFSQFLLAKEKFANIYAVINAALSITKGLRKLYQRGYSYQDLNDGNFFINPKNGDVLICDNDNVAPNNENLGIMGKCRYMAPELVAQSSDEIKKPDIKTDRFSLSVILYLILFLNHPLEGKRTLKKPCMTEELERKFYGEEALFVWDDSDDSNRPVRGVHSNEIALWPIYPKFIRDNFKKAFSKECLKTDRDQRILEKEWIRIFIELRNRTIKCPFCGEETFLYEDIDEVSCINCNKKLPQYLTLKIKKYNIPIIEGEKVYTCHLKDTDNFNDEIGEIVTSKVNKSAIGLKNKSINTWKAILPNGLTKSYMNGEVIKLGKGLKIDFGDNVVGEIML